jgi:hypothetical protein
MKSIKMFWAGRKCNTREKGNYISASQQGQQLFIFRTLWSSKSGDANRPETVLLHPSALQSLAADKASTRLLNAWPNNCTFEMERQSIHVFAAGFLGSEAINPKCSQIQSCTGSVVKTDRQQFHVKQFHGSTGLWHMCQLNAPSLIFCTISVFNRKAATAVIRSASVEGWHVVA